MIFIALFISDYSNDTGVVVDDEEDLAKASLADLVAGLIGLLELTEGEVVAHKNFVAHLELPHGVHRSYLSLLETLLVQRLRVIYEFAVLLHRYLLFYYRLLLLLVLHYVAALNLQHQVLRLQVLFVYRNVVLFALGRQQVLVNRTPENFRTCFIWDYLSFPSIVIDKVP